MRSGLILGLGLAGTVFIGACSSPSEDQAKANSAQSPISTNRATGTENLNSNGIPVTNGAVVTPQNVDANAAIAAGSDAVTPNVPDRLANKMDQIKRGAGEMDPAAVASQNARPAPDNSTFTSYLSDAGYEIRTFKNHPSLLRVEKRTAEAGKQTVRVFLRNGKVVEVPAQSLGALATVPAAVIASAAGVSPAQDKQPPPGSTGAKSPGN